ncbi:hypothetical protein [Peribacillus simplex]|uniref:hypothetical protein n=1 Tax=Peribacillus simplex TaxID=1478 RepID=UPI00333C0A03
MIFTEGTIIKKKNIVFKQTNMVDFRMGGHPILLPIEFGFDDSIMYYLTLSSQIHHYSKDPERYYPLKKKSGNGLKTASLVDLKYVYKCPKISTNPMGNIDPYDLEQVMNKFLRYMGIVKDNDCNELLALIN